MVKDGKECKNARNSRGKRAEKLSPQEKEVLGDKLHEHQIIVD
jgi:hypothetical protein